jgi:anti-sigma factor RsiW
MDPHDDPELRRVLKNHTEYFKAPADVRSRVLATVRQTSDEHAPWHTSLGEQLRAWFALPLTRMSAAFAAGVCAAVLTMTLFYRPATDDAALLALVSDHSRAQLTGSTIEVASRSEHTVKPWLSAKLGYSPNVVDLADAGFPLAGGRRGFVGSVPVAVMVYAYGEHEIDLYALRGDVAAQLGGRLLAKDGYNLRSWQDGGLRYIAISDVAAGRLDEFTKLAQERQAHPAD